MGILSPPTLMSPFSVVPVRYALTDESHIASTNALAVSVKISTKLALSVGYAIQDNSKPPEGAKKLDTLETVNIVYSF